MRAMKRNKRVFYYASFVGRELESYMDEYSNEVFTGEHRIVYSNPAMFKANISAARGESEARVFGESLDYTRAISMANKGKPPISETSILWIDTLPVIEPDGSTETPHDYIVKAIAESLNNTLIAVQKVEVSR